MKTILKALNIVGIESAVPTKRHSFVETPPPFTEEEIQKIYKLTGIYSRRIADKKFCASDLCLFAAQRLLARLDWDPKSIDVLIFVSQGPDYPLPATACLMQSYLGLPLTAACFDVTLGCSGFTYGLFIANQLLQNSTGKRALILCGDTATRNLSKEAKPLFGDAGSAAAIEYTPDWPDSYAVMGTDGRGGKYIALESGGSRGAIDLDDMPSAIEHLHSLGHKATLQLNGSAIFSFSLQILPPLMNELMDFAQIALNDVDMFIMHQANKFILEHLRKKLGVSEEKYIIDLEDFGNTSSASIPLAMCNKLVDFYSNIPKKTVLTGFGVGWSWLSILTDIKPRIPFELVEMPDDITPLKLEQ